MDPEVHIFGKKLLRECRPILKKMIPDIMLKNFPNSPVGDFILIHWGETWCIFEGSQRSVIELARSRQYKTLTCGFSAYDTLVLSSSSEEQSVVSLQREIRTLSSQLLEPGDFLIQKSEARSDAAILLGTAVLLLLDQKNSVFEF